MLKVRIKDGAFAHDLSSSPGKSPTNFIWVRDDAAADQSTFITDTNLFKHRGGIAWLVEPPSVSIDCYRYIYENNHLYKNVLTFDKTLLDLGQNYLFCPCGGGSRLKFNEVQIYEKSKICSMILSNKTSTEGHKLRHYLKSLVINTGMVDIFQPSGDQYIDKIVACKNYMFGIVVQNGNTPHYFAEQLLDCFLTGMIPIYWGCNTLGNFFDKSGFIQIESESQYLDVVNSLSKELYLSKLNSVKVNFELAKKYFITEDWIFNNYPFLFKDDC